MNAKTIQTNSQQLPYGAVTQQQFKLLFSQLKKEPKGIRLKDLLDMLGIPRGTGPKLIRRIRDAGLVRIVELPKKNKCKWHKWHGPYFIIPTNKLFEMSIEEALKKVTKKPGRPTGWRKSTSSPTKTSINMSELYEVFEECIDLIDTFYGPPGSNNIDRDLIVRARAILAKVRGEEN